MSGFGSKQPLVVKADLDRVVRIWLHASWTVENERDSSVTLVYHLHGIAGPGSRYQRMNTVAARIMLEKDGDSVTVVPLRPKPGNTVGGLATYKSCLTKMRKELAST